MSGFDKIGSSCEPFAGGDVAEAIRQYPYALLIKTDGVELVDTGKGFSVDRLTEARAFSETAELHLIRANGAWRGRVRTDGAGEETEIFDQRQLLWGKCKASSGGESVLKEDRGISLKVPLEMPVEMPKGSDSRAFLKIRSYLAADRFEFTDFRICGIGTAEVTQYAD